MATVRFGTRVRVVSSGSRARRPSNLVPLFLVVAVLSFVGAIAADIMHRGNAARLARYETDPSCVSGTTPGDGISPVWPAGRPCHAESAVVTARWRYYQRTLVTYRLALRTADGTTDSLELEAADDRTAWEAATPGTTVRVQRFADLSPTAPRHVTLIHVGSLTVRSSWNPAWRGDDTMAGVVFLSIVSFASLIGVWRGARRQRADEAAFA